MNIIIKHRHMHESDEQILWFYLKLSELPNMKMNAFTKKKNERLYIYVSYLI